MHHEKFGQDYAVFDSRYMSSELGCDRARGEVSTNPDAQGWYTIKKGAPRPEVGKSFGRQM